MDWLEKVLLFLCVCVAATHWQFPHQESNPGSPAVEARSLNHWTTRDVPASFFLKKKKNCHCVFIFYWNIIALQSCISFCHTTT